MVEESKKNICMSIPFLTPEHASIACDVLAVDKELKSSGVNREISCDGVILTEFSRSRFEETKSCCECISQECFIDCEDYKPISRELNSLGIMPEHTPAPTPARSLYGFFMYVFSKTMLGIYFIWAFVPNYYLHYINIYYYPLKYWSTAVPIQCLVALTLFTFLIYPSLNMILTSNIDSINTIRDPFSQYNNVRKEYNYNAKGICTCVDESKCMKYSIAPSTKEFEENTVPPLRDLNISLVCKKLYLNKPDK